MSYNYSMKSGHDRKREFKPRKPRDQVKSKLVKVRVSPGEHDQVQRMADQRGVTMSDMIREFLFQDGVNENKSR